MPGTLFVVATPIGNLEDITARALRVLREVAIIAAEDTRRTAHLLARYAIATPTTSLHEHNEARKALALLARLERGDSVAVVSDAGTPGVSDPGQFLVRKAIAAGIPVVAIPGPSAVIAALAASGFPGDTFAFLGFPPTRSSDRTQWFSDLASAARTVVFFEAPHRVRQTLEQLLASVGNCEVAIGRELTKEHEEWVRGPIDMVMQGLTTTRGEFTIVTHIGRTVSTPIAAAVKDSLLLHELGELTLEPGLSKRQAINILARKHGRQPNEVYAAIERAKKLGV